MSLRAGIRVGSTTDKPALQDRIKQYKPRKLPMPADKIRKFELPYVAKSTSPHLGQESLARKCVRRLVENFERAPAMPDRVPKQYVRDIFFELPVDLDPCVAARYICDENYWKKRCIEQFGWAKCDISQHGLLWKNMFFECWLQHRLEAYNQKEESMERLLEEIQTYADCIFTLRLTLLPSSFNPIPASVFSCLPNLTKLAINYGVRDLGMKYDRLLFGLKNMDAELLARSLYTCTPCLCTLILSRNLIDDDLLRELVLGLRRNRTIIILDLSHNHITNHGARMLSKVLLEKTCITSLNLTDNMLHAEGGRYLARSLRANETLTDLNLRLNRLTDLGGRLLLDGVLDNRILTRLNVSGNALAGESMAALTAVLRSRTCAVCSLDLSNNEFEAEHLQALCQTLEEQQTCISSLDLRMNKFFAEECEDTLKHIEELVHGNEIRYQENQRDDPALKATADAADFGIPAE